MVLRFLFILAFFVPAAVHAGEVPTERLRRHIQILASDEYQGRAPGSEGEAKTISYISRQLAALGLEPAGAGDGWYQPVPMVVRKPVRHRARWSGRTALSLGEEDLVLVGKGALETVAGAPVIFGGHGAVMPEHGIDHLAGPRLDGAVVLILYEAPDFEGFPPFSERVKAAAARGAAAVIGIIGSDVPWRSAREIYDDERVRLDNEVLAAVQGIVSQAGAARLVAAAGSDLGRLLNGSTGPGFRAIPLDLRANLEVRTDVRPLLSSNVVGRLKGKGGTGQSVLFLAHWDHLGVCRPEGAPDRICNGAVDNASGVAALIEIARGLAQGPRPQRDILFLATTAEEMGLLGAEHFAQHPAVPLDSIVAAFNLDTVAIGARGGQVALIGRGFDSLDAIIEESVSEAGRELDEDEEADEYLERQDGWTLRRRGVPAVMVLSSFSDMRALGHFLSGPYHKPSDDLRRPIELGGAAEDAELLIALGRKLADPAIYRPQGRQPALARP